MASNRRSATIKPDDALILPQRANPAGWNSREPQGNVGKIGAAFGVSASTCLVY
jgi:hypothetical protein